MFFSSPDPDTRTVLVVPSETRSFSSLLFMVLVIGAIGIFAFWYYETYKADADADLSVANNAAQEQSVNTDIPAELEPSAGIPPSSGQSPDMMSLLASSLMGTSSSGSSGEVAAIGEAVEAVAGNLGGGQMAEANAVIEQQVENIKNADDGFEHSVRDAVGRTVNDRDGNKVGEVHDIIVDKKTGDAKAVIVNKDGSYESDLSALVFDEILTQTPKGEVNAAAPETEIKNKKEFVYTKLDKEKFLSLRQLHDGQVIDDTGKVAGQINAIIYENAEAQSIYFVLQPNLAPTGKPRLYKLDFKEANIIESPDGYDVKLSKKQTEDFAAYLYADETADTN